VTCPAAFPTKLIVGSVIQICLDAGSSHSGEDLASGDVLPSLLSGANVAGFIKVADAMKQQGDWW
jgi:glutamate dehydrogenase (NADP+)